MDKVELKAKLKKIAQQSAGKTLLTLYFLYLCFYHICNDKHSICDYR